MPRPLSTPISPAFDPRRVPEVGRDHHLPAVRPERLTAAALRAQWRTQPAWQPEVREEPRFTDRPRTPAAVLVGLVMGECNAQERGSGLQVLLTERTAHLPTHGGQIAFPGGKLDAGDRDAIAAALREAHEEVGLSPAAAEVLGTLPTYTTGTGFVITPVVALLPPRVALQPNPGEVADVFQVPLSFLMNPAHHRRHATDWEGVRREWYSMPYTEAHPAPCAGAQPMRERYIWGATAGMLRNLYRFLQA